MVASQKIEDLPKACEMCSQYFGLTLASLDWVMYHVIWYVHYPITVPVLI